MLLTFFARFILTLKVGGYARGHMLAPVQEPIDFGRMQNDVLILILQCSHTPFQVHTNIEGGWISSGEMQAPIKKYTESDRM